MDCLFYGYLPFLIRGERQLDVRKLTCNLFILPYPRWTLPIGSSGPTEEGLRLPL